MPNPDAQWLRWSIAFVWLATGLAVFHPYYREVGHDYLARLGLPDALMWVTCAFEVLLALRVALGNAATWITVLQCGMIVVFSLLLAWVDPLLLVHPFGMLVKNLLLLAAIGAVWLEEREGWSRRALWLLRAGIGSVWIIEGLFLKILFPQPGNFSLAVSSGLVPFDPELFVQLLGWAELLAGVAVLVLRGWRLRGLLLAQMIALVIFPGVLGMQLPQMWFHPFGPFIKNVPLLVATLVVFRLVLSSHPLRAVASAR